MKKIAKWVGFFLLGLVVFIAVGISVARSRLHRWPDVIDYADFKISRASREAGYVFDRVRFEFDGKPCTIAFRYSPKGLQEAPAVLLINGFGDRMNSWWKIIESRRRAGLHYGNYFMVDWPLHGDSDCEQAEGPRKAAEVIHRGLDTLQAEGKLSTPPAIAVGSSLGVIVSAYLADYYPELRFMWIVPPLLREPESATLFAFVSGLKSEADTAAFMARVKTDPRPLPDFVLKAVHRQITRAVPTLVAMDANDVRRQVLTITPDRVTIVAGEKDALCPPTQLDPEFRKRFGKRFFTLAGCHHDLMNTCIGALMPHLPD